MIICQKYRFPLWVGSMLVLPDRLERRKTARKTQIIYCFEVHDPGDPFRRDAIDANSVSNRIPIISNPIHWSKTSRRAKHCKTIMLINSNKKAPLILPCCSPPFCWAFFSPGKATGSTLPPMASPSLRLSTRAVCVLKRSSSNNFSALASGAAWLIQQMI